MRIHLIILCCLLTGILSAQETATLKGTIFDENGAAVEGINITLKNDVTKGTYSNALGKFELRLPANKKVTLQFTSITHQNYETTLKLEPNEVREWDIELNSKLIQGPDVTITAKKDGEVVSMFYLEPQVEAVNPSGHLEAMLTYSGLGVSNVGGESSSAYSVRGGNFDENLVYVNGFEVHRPFLIRSGQQEGLSFANPNMVKDIAFSSGGFQPRYGDKMSSVLDVRYRKPESFGGSVSGSLLGVSAHLEGATKNEKLTFITGFRQKTSQYIFQGLETKGEYSPSFIDFQGYLTWQMSDKLEWELIGNYAKNKFVFYPEDRETTFGVVNQVLRLSIYYDGGEQDEYATTMGGLALNQKISDNFKLKYMVSAYQTNEREAFDIIGEYYLGEVESDFAQEDFGQVNYSLGTGTLHEWARNELETQIFAGAVKGYYFKGKHNLLWGLDYRHEIIDDKLLEWERIDSAGYSLPYSNSEVLIDSYLKSGFQLESNRFSGFIQDSWRFSDTARFAMTYGARFQYWDVNKEFLVSPRLQFSYKPNVHKDLYFTGAAGLYYQPPFYREMRALDGTVNLDLKAQKSAHFVAGLDFVFNAWDRPFKFTTEVYYKHLWDLVPYELDNVLIRYFGDNLSTGYAAGIDFRLNGELVEGAESWVSMSVMSTREDLKDDYYYEYFDAEGNQVFQGQVSTEEIVDSNRVEPGYIPRPTDQRVNFALFFQDYLPNNENFKVHLNMVFGSGLPFGPPDGQKYQDDFRIPPYRRVDIGFSAQLYSEDREKGPAKGIFSGLESVWASLEIYNLFGISNTVSYLWIKDTRNNQYAVPNYLSSRRVNARLVINF